MKQGFTKIAVVLDRSGSMEPIKAATIDLFNEFVNGQKQEPGEASILLTQFDHEYEVVLDKPLNAIEPLNQETYKPRGSTALFDAIGRTVVDLGKSLKAMAESARPDKVLFVILTDGYENASTDFKREKIREMITHQQDKYKWHFVFLGANQDAVLTAQGFNIPAQAAMTYTAAASSVSNVTRSMNSYAAQYRSSPISGQSVNMGFSDEDRKLAVEVEDEDENKPKEAKQQNQGQ